MRPAVTIFLFLAGCAGSSVAVTKLEPGALPPRATVEYDAALTALQNGAFDDVTSRAGATADERALAVALLDAEMGRFAAAEPTLQRLAAAPAGPVQNRSLRAHIALLVGQMRWADLQRLYADEKQAAEIMPLARAWADAVPERVTFTAPSATLPATLEDADMPFVEVRVGGHPFKFLVDTGASFTLITSDVAATAGIRPSEMDSDFGTATSRRISVRPAVLPRLSVGNAVFENHACVVADPGDMEFKRLFVTFLRLDGVLGWNAIRSLDIEVDFRVPEVTIREPRRRVVERNLFWLGKPIVRARLADGVPVLADLDTGAAETTLRPYFFEALPPEYREKTAGKTREGTERVWGAGGSERVRTQAVDRLSVVLDGHLLEFRAPRSRGPGFPSIFCPVLQFGNDIALKGTMRIDYANGALELGP